MLSWENRGLAGSNKPSARMPLPQGRVLSVRPVLLWLARLLMEKHGLRVSACRYFPACGQ